MSQFRLLISATAFCLGLLFLNPPFSTAQAEKSTAASDFPDSIDSPDSIDPFRIRVNVSEIQLDVVVVDNKGRPITDLTADDFEIYQDKLPQDVASSVYINDQTQAAAPGLFLKRCA